MPHDPDWRLSAVCASVDSELFYPEHGQSATTAKRICRTCPVRDDCLDEAMSHGEKYGIWGGLSERERTRMRKAQ